MFAFSAPWILLFLPLPLLLWLLLPPIKTISGQALHAPFLQHLQKLFADQPLLVRGSVRHLGLATFIWVLLVVAAAGPQWLGKPMQIARAGRNIMLAVDISGSMQIPDMTVNHQAVSRLTALQQVADQFIQQRQGDRIGLVLFGSKAYLQTPLTFDRTTVQAMLNDSSVGLAGELTSLGDAMALAIKHLKDLPENNRVLILLTDGASNSGHFNPLDAALLASQYHIKVYTIGFGSDHFQMPTAFGSQAINPSADLDENTLKLIAEKTNGRYFRAKNTAELNQIYNAINQLEPVNQDKFEYRPEESLYSWPLAIAFLLAFSLLCKRAWPQLRTTALSASNKPFISKEEV